MWQCRAGLGNSPRTILEELARIPSEHELPAVAINPRIKCSDDFSAEASICLEPVCRFCFKLD
jgi:hypothetical protein